jgi:glycerol-3-phosphate dehydrogenase
MDTESPRPAPGGPLMDREAAMDAAATSDLDILVVGGGITGAGIALDAAARGLQVALVERDDVGSGTSSKSSKLVHGGLRYLEQREFGLVYEGVRERNLLRRNAAHLVRPLGFVVPTPTRAAHAAMKAGLTLYDAMAAGRNVRAHRRLDTTELLDRAPGLVNGIGLGGYRYYDCQTDDARLTLGIAQAARRRGALVANHAEVVDFLRFGDRVVGVVVRDRLGGGTVEMTARWVVSATGVWADRVRRIDDAARPLLTPSKGVHLVFDSHDVHVRDGALVSSGAGDGRLVFVIPWGEQVIVGTTDEHYEGELDDPAVDDVDASYLLHAVNESFGTALGARDAIAGWAGLRPLLRGSHESAASRDLSRRHAIFEQPPGLVTITGGKLTTYRQMAEDAVDFVVRQEGAQLASRTRHIPLGPSGPIEHALRDLEDLCRILGIDPAAAGSLLHRHGFDAPAVASFCAERGEDDRLVRGLPYLRGEVRWAVRHELARTLDDVLQRRLRVSFRDRRAGGEGASWAADVMAEELGWDPDRREAELARYLDAVEAERGVIPLDRGWARDTTRSA